MARQIHSVCWRGEDSKSRVGLQVLSARHRIVFKRHLGSHMRIITGDSESTMATVKDLRYHPFMGRLSVTNMYLDSHAIGAGIGAHNDAKEIEEGFGLDDPIQEDYDLLMHELRRGSIGVFDLELAEGIGSVWQNEIITKS